MQCSVGRSPRRLITGTQACEKEDWWAEPLLEMSKFSAYRNEKWQSETFPEPLDPTYIYIVCERKYKVISYVPLCVLSRLSFNKDGQWLVRSEYKSYWQPGWTCQNRPRDHGLSQTTWRTRASDWNNIQINIWLGQKLSYPTVLT